MLTFDSNCVHTLNINKLSAFEVLLASGLKRLYFSCSHEFFSVLTPDGWLLSIKPENKHVTLTDGFHCLREIMKSVPYGSHSKREWRMGYGE
mgnify:CR=1 FL=1